MDLQTKLVVALAALALQVVLLLGVGWKAYGLGEEHERAKLMAKVEAADKRAEEISSRFEDKLAKLKVVNRTINNEVRREVEKQVYTDCKVPESGRAVLGRAVGIANGWLPTDTPADALREGQPRGGLPGAAPAGR